MKKKKPNPIALLPIVVFLVLYLGVGIYFEYIHPVEGQMGFYVMSVVVAFMIALVVAFLQNGKVSFDDKMKICAKGIGDENITIMIFIFLIAGCFSGIAKEAGGAASTANLLLSIIPGKFAIPGLFLIACLISMSMGTSVGTISVLAPIAVTVAQNGGFNLPFCIGTVVGGAMFGDNLSFISDTTIAATKTQGVEMKDKFRANFRIALPAAVITFIILIVYAVVGREARIGTFEYSIPQALPYFIVLAMALVGINVFVVLGTGIVLFMIVGALTHSLSFMTAFTSMGAGSSGMFETIIVTGGFEAILDFIKIHFGGKRGGMVGIGLLTILVDIATANNTVAIVLAAPIAKQISEEYKISPIKTASLLDTCSCIAQGIIPYGAQLLVAASLAGISSMKIIPFLYYPYLLAVFVVISIIIDRKAADF